jgi:hypothetical protein
MTCTLRLAVLSLLTLLVITPALAQFQHGANGLAAIPSGGNGCSGYHAAAVPAAVNAPRPHLAKPADGQDAYATALAYVATFYPRWFTYTQSSGTTCNQLVGPDKISPIYHVVVAINDDTFYASAFIGVKKQPLVVTVPATKDHYSVLQLDGYGSVFTAIPSLQPGVYALTGPDWVETLPPEVIRIPIPYNYSELIFRADKYAANGQDMRAEAELFRRNLHAASLSDYENDHNSGATMINPETDFAVPIKQIADGLIANDAITFLTQLQTAVLDSTTQPLTPEEQMLSDHFNSLFMDHNLDPDFIAGAQAAHAALVTDYVTQTLPGTTWVTLTDMGYWDGSPKGYLDRSAITEYIQFGNNHSTAVYYQTFLDNHGKPLDGGSGSYILTFPKGGQPETNRFWSLTAYLPESIELVPNDANKYVVASYTPGLVTNSDGSVSIYMLASLPPGVPESNWLPVPKGQFNVMLRDYGPEGSVLDNTYTPPPVTSAIAAHN